MLMVVKSQNWSGLHIYNAEFKNEQGFLVFILNWVLEMSKSHVTVKAECQELSIMDFS